MQNTEEEKYSWVTSFVVTLVLVLLAFCGLVKRVVAGLDNMDMTTFETITKIFSGLLIPLIAILAAYIAYQQAQTAKRKLKLDTFDKRYAIFIAVMDFLSLVVGNINVTNEQLFKLIQETKSSYFLFGEDIYTYIDDVYKKAIRLRLANQILNGRREISEEERTRLVNQDQELLEWFMQQAEEARQKFSKYLKLDY